MSNLAFPGSKVSSYLCCVCGFEVPLTPLLEAVLTFLVCIPSWMASLIFFRPFLSPSSEITLSLAESLLGDIGSRLNTHNSTESTEMHKWKNGGWLIVGYDETADDYPAVALKNFMFFLLLLPLWSLFCFFMTDRRMLADLSGRAANA